MRTVVRDSFARHTIRAERVPTPYGETCTFCGTVRYGRPTTEGPAASAAHPRPRPWLYRFHVDDDSGARCSGPILGGRLFCSRDCAEVYSGQPFNEENR